MQATAARERRPRPLPRCAPSPSGDRPLGLPGLPDPAPQRRRRRLRAEQDRGRADEGVPRRPRHAGRGLGERSRDRRRADRIGRARRCCARVPAAAPSTSRTCRTRSSSALMRGGHHEVARAYVLYRERRAQERASRARRRPTAEPAADGHRPRHPRAARLGAAAGADRVGVRRPRRRRPARADPRRDASATSTTACRSTRCTRRRSSPRAR